MRVLFFVQSLSTSLPWMEKNGVPRLGVDSHTYSACCFGPKCDHSLFCHGKLRSANKSKESLIHNIRHDYDLHLY